MNWIVACVRCGCVIRTTDFESERGDLLSIYCSTQEKCRWSSFTSTGKDRVAHVFKDGDPSRCTSHEDCPLKLPTHSELRDNAGNLKKFPCGHVGDKRKGTLDYCRVCRRDGADGPCPGGHSGIYSGLDATGNAHRACMTCERPISP